MKVAIVQPYFFPYIGYWQLVSMADIFVVYDDVNFINRGWIHRNRILMGGKPRYFNLPLLGASQNKLINEIDVNHDERLTKRNLCILHDAYRKAPHYSAVQPVIEKILRCDRVKVSDYLLESIQVICDFLELDKQIMVSSRIEKNNTLHGQEKILEICRCLGADEYINPIGGIGLYSFQRFNEEAVKLYFIRSMPLSYKQFENEFQANLSLIDVMMFNPVDRIQFFLQQYELLGENDIREGEMA